ncbi:hypothetical protein ABIE67_006517 [Streptomyces sp. V4I8]|uniref:hypothetical protein n=1 Tax=Streptomyces sp. V4I8 TaxID=3156469 RepID=UPI0035143E01
MRSTREISEGDPIPMLFLVAALLLLGVLLGTVAHAPLAFTVVAAAVIAAWLGIFAARERRARRN